MCDMCIVEAECPDLTIVYSFALDNVIVMINNSELHDYEGGSLLDREY